MDHNNNTTTTVDIIIIIYMIIITRWIYKINYCCGDVRIMARDNYRRFENKEQRHTSSKLRKNTHTHTSWFKRPWSFKLEFQFCLGRHLKTFNDTNAERYGRVTYLPAKCNDYNANAYLFVPTDIIIIIIVTIIFSALEQ